jgi:hypothetical protein
LFGYAPPEAKDLELREGLHVIKEQRLFCHKPASSGVYNIERQEKASESDPLSRNNHSGTGGLSGTENEGEKMKNRRLTVFCLAALALAGTPRAWQEASKLLAVLQHKAQVKFWSMAMQPKNRESADTELIAAVQLVESSPAELDSNCPLEQKESPANRVAGNSQAGRKLDSASLRPQARTERQSAEAVPLSHAGLIAKALKAPRGDSNAESLRHSRSIPEIEPSEIAVGRSELLALHGSPVAAPRPAAGKKEDTFRFVMIPAPNAAPIPLTKEAIVQFKLLRKAVEEPKTIRQKNRPPVIKGATAYSPGS